MSDCAAILNVSPAATDYGKCVRLIPGAGALPVTFQYPLTGATAVTRVATAVASGLLLAANVSRAKMTVCNNAGSNLYVKYGAVASLVAGAESFTVKIPPGQTWQEMDPGIYRGIVDCIWDGADASGEALVTESSY